MHEKLICGELVKHSRTNWRMEKKTCTTSFNDERMFAKMKLMPDVRGQLACHQKAIS